MTRFIVFNGAPSTRECSASQKDSGWTTRTRWSTTTVELSPPHVDSTDLTEGSVPRKQVEGVLRNKGSRPTQGVTGIERDDPAVCDQAKKKPRLSIETQEFESFFMLPPPSQPRPLPPSRRTQAEPSLTRSQRHDKSFLDEANETTNVSFSRYDSTGAALTTFDLTSNPERPSMIAINSFDEDDDTSYASSCDLSIGPPPALPWALHDLTKLDQLRNRYASLTSSTITTGVTVSVLGVITSVDSRETANSRVTELVLEDDTGANAKLVAWGNPGIELAQALRTGDVVFFGKLRLYRSNYSSNLELKLVEHTSQVGIAYRTRVFDSQDALYTFHENWAQEFGQARAVWDIVAWWNRHREHDFS